jgi:hypothetical protein
LQQLTYSLFSFQIKTDPEEVVAEDGTRNEDSPDSSLAPGTPVKSEKVVGSTPIKKEIKVEPVGVPPPVSKEFQVQYFYSNYDSENDSVQCFVIVITIAVTFIGSQLARLARP